MDSYMALNGLCFIVTWTIFKNHLLEIGLTQHWETKALHMLTTIHLFYCIMCGDPREHKFIEIALGWGADHIRLFTLHLRVRDRTTWFWRHVGTAFGHFLLGSYNFMVMALGSCVKWPLEPPPPLPESGAYSATHHEYPNKHIAKSHNLRVGLVGNIIWGQRWKSSVSHPHPRHHPTHYLIAPFPLELELASFGGVILGVAKLS